MIQVARINGPKLQKPSKVSADAYGRAARARLQAFVAGKGRHHKLGGC